MNDMEENRKNVVIGHPTKGLGFSPSLSLSL
jgi:hypothetical protein